MLPVPPDPADTDFLVGRDSGHRPNRRQVLRRTAALGAAAASFVTAEGALRTPASAAAGHGGHARGARAQHQAAQHTHHDAHPDHPAHHHSRGRQRVELQPTGSGELRAATVALHHDDFERAGDGAWVSRVVATSAFTMVALTWDADSAAATPGVRVRARGGRWHGWMHLPASEDGPDRDEARAGAPRATSVAWVGAADAVTVRVSGAVPQGLSLHLVLSEPVAADRSARRRRLHAGAATYAGSRPGRAGLGRAALLPNPVPQPTILSRAAWGANESWRDGSPRYNTTIKQVHIHHTATDNGYTAAEVPALIRGMYYYHTHTLGWSDIAYNFLVDIYGQIWEGRYGGIDQAVRGAHTLGFNAESTGFSVIGNYQTAQPSAAVLSSLAALAAWKLTPYGRDPLGTIAVTSEGSDKFANGRTVTLPVIDGHRDTNDTACPGNYLYAQLQTVRNAAKVGMGQGTITVSSPFTVTGSLLVGQTLTVAPGAYSPTDAVVTYSWQRDGADIPGAVASTYLVTPDDVGHTLSAHLTLTRDGYVALGQDAATAAPVMTTPTVTLHGVGHNDGRMRVKVRIDAPGVRAAGGELIVTANLKGVKHRRVVKVGKGVAVARFVGLPPGRYFVSAAYSGSPRIQAGRVHMHVKIPRWKGKPQG